MNLECLFFGCDDDRPEVDPQRDVICVRCRRCGRQSRGIAVGPLRVDVRYATPAGNARHVALRVYRRWLRERAAHAVRLEA